MRSKILAGTTSLSAPIYVTNSAAGGGLGSLVFNTSGLVGEYRRAGSSTWTSISLSAGTLGTFGSGSTWVADGSLAGAYEVGIPNAALASGVPWVAVRFYGAANMTPVLLYFELDAVNYQSATGFVSSVPSVVGAVGSVTGLTTATIATAVLTDTGDNTTAGSPGKILAQLLGAFTSTTSVFTTASLVNAPTGGSAPTTAQIATAVWTDLLSSSDFSTASSVGSLTKANAVTLLSTGMDAVITETGVNAAQALALILDMCAAKLSGLPTGPAVIRDINDTVNRITITFDSNNNRTGSVINNLPSV